MIDNLSFYNTQLSPSERTADGKPWLAVRLFVPRIEDIAHLLADNGIEMFIPIENTTVEDSEHHRRHIQRPVLRNYLFVKKDRSLMEIQKTMSDIPFPTALMKRTNKPGDKFAEIEANEMKEFMIMCNPDITMKYFLTQEQAQLKKGTEVLVKYGPLKGLSGKLVRQSKRYFLLKEVPGIAVMLKVGRWCCKPLMETKAP